jgi:TRAP-type mannitol/chloroaromatic compound transport system permease large subunit
VRDDNAKRRKKKTAINGENKLSVQQEYFTFLFYFIFLFFLSFFLSFFGPSFLLFPVFIPVILVMSRFTVLVQFI